MTAGENVELVRRTYEAFNRDGQTGTLPFLDADVEWDESALPARQRPGVFRGHEGVLALGRQNDELWEEISVEPSRIVDAGNGHVVAFLLVAGRGRFTGEPVELTIGHLWDIRDGKGTRVKLFLDPQRAREEAGTS